MQHKKIEFKQCNAQKEIIKHYELLQSTFNFLQKKIRMTCTVKIYLKSNIQKLQFLHKGSVRQ